MENSKSEFNCYLVHVLPLLGRKQKFLPLFEGKLQKQTDLPKTKFAPLQSCKQRRFSDYGFSLSAEKERFLRTNLVFTLAKPDVEPNFV